MRYIIISTVPIHGHVAPMLAVARHFVDRGDHVRFITGGRFASAVRSTGAEFWALPASADFDDQLDLNVRFPSRAALSGAKAIAFDAIELFTRPAKSQYETVMSAHAAQPADVLLVDPAFAGAAHVLGHPGRCRPAVVMCGMLPLSISSRDTAPFGMGLAPMTGLIGRGRNALLAVVARHLLADAQRLADLTHRELHGMPLPGPLLDWGRNAEAIAQFTVSSFEYPRKDAPANLHFVGPILSSGPALPLPAWWADLDGVRPIVHVTQGTIANKDFNQLVVPTIHALADEDVLVVASTGGRPIATLPPLPANARVAEYLPYDMLMPKTRVFVTNAGYGGVQFALRHGVPIVASGGKEDKPEVGARIAWAGVGRRLNHLSPAASVLRRTVLEVLKDPRYKRAAANISQEMAVSGGLRALESIVDAVAVPVFNSNTGNQSESR